MCAITGITLKKINLPSRVTIWRNTITFILFYFFVDQFMLFLTRILIVQWIVSSCIFTLCFPATFSWELGSNFGLGKLQMQEVLSFTISVEVQKLTKEQFIKWAFPVTAVSQQTPPGMLVGNPHHFHIWMVGQMGRIALCWRFSVGSIALHSQNPLYASFLQFFPFQD